MKIHLLRHADAENSVTTDAARVLTAKGLVQAVRVGDFLARTLEPIELILTSPYVRAFQTAKAVAEKLNHVPLIKDPRLGCGLAPHVGLSIIQEYHKLNNILLVGHQPDLGFLAAHLLTRDVAFNIEFQKASLLTVALHRLKPGGGFLESYINVGQM